MNTNQTHIEQQNEMYKQAFAKGVKAGLESVGYDVDGTHAHKVASAIKLADSHLESVDQANRVAIDDCKRSIISMIYGS